MLTVPRWPTTHQIGIAMSGSGSVLLPDLTGTNTVSVLTSFGEQRLSALFVLTVANFWRQRGNGDSVLLGRGPGPDSRHSDYFFHW